MASIRLKGVTRAFGPKIAVNDVNLDVADGEFLVLLGPSGCGKSTLLRMLAGLESMTGGEIHLDGRRVDTLPPSARDMAFVFQSYALYPHMTVRRNITFPLIMRQHRWWFHVPVLGGFAKRRIERSPEVAELVRRTAQILALTDMLDRLPRTLSGGQRQRVALGRAMVRKPQVFLMDEPLSNLDAKLRTAMRGEIIKLHQQVGGTFVYVTHDQIEAMTMGTRIALMRDGMVQQFGTAREIYAEPVNTYVARFIGTPPMNVLVAAADGPDAVRVGEARLELPPALAAACRAARGGLLLGVRPHALDMQPAGAAGTLAGEIALVEHIGAESLITVRLAQARTAHDEEGAPPDELMVATPGYSELRPGEKVGVRLNLAEAVLFSAETRHRIGGF
ncbi:MAG: ABC transporter ATP-binding protein [Rhodospirillales bacterium]|nr:ABC transporter ATP-binding protein [Rhodospirillales bacterium]MDE2577135.1 ABC transporter ATP-binding protein [Rhodospirillales bacterium]